MPSLYAPDERGLAVKEISRVLAPDGLLDSRFFKPRSAEWVQAQPFVADHFGLDVSEVRALLHGPLVCESIREEAIAIYVRSRKPGPRDLASKI